jgi:hypothetical protein
MVRVPRGALLAVSLALALAACSDDDTAAPSSSTADTTTTTESTTTTEPPPDPTVIPEDPADIDEEYVEAVLAELFHLEGEVLRIAQRDGASPELSERLLAIYEGDVEETRLQLLVEATASDFADYFEPVGDVVVDVLEIVHATTTCTSADTQQDFRGIGPAAAANDAVPMRVEMRAKAAASPFNPTAWVVTLMQPTAQDAPPAPCAG